MIAARQLAESVLDDVVALRHELHRHPELGISTPWTQAQVLGALAELPLEISTGQACTSVTAVLRGGGVAHDAVHTPTVLLRADMDALPVVEATAQPFASYEEGLMHACGHDLHTSSLVGAARALCGVRDQLCGDIVFMFQPGEEVIESGARIMIEEGVLDAAGRRVDRAFGLHAMSAMVPHGMVWTRPGTVMAGVDWFFVDVVGTGGHGSTPHLGNDPVPVMAEIILALQTAATRKFSAFDPVVVNCGVVTAGQAGNVMPERCRIEGTVRTLSQENRAKVKDVFIALMTNIGTAHGMHVDVDWQPAFGPTINTAAEAEFALAQAALVVGADRVHRMDTPWMASEDFSKILDQVPGAFCLYSAIPDDIALDDAAANHSERATFDDSALATAVALYIQFAVASLDELAQQRSIPAR